MHIKTSHQGLIAAAALLLSVSCVRLTTVSGTADPHGLFAGYQAADKIQQDATEIASYMIIMGLFDEGYDQYVAKVREAEAKGKKITTKHVSYPYYTKITAYAK